MNASLEPSPTPRRRSLPDFWYRWLYHWVNALYFEQVKVLHPERIPREGPVLLLGLHRNGAVDGFVYHEALAGPTFLISSQLRRNVFARLFFHGIAVTRTKDQGDRAENGAALAECLAVLRSGGRLCIFPEGTSSLGPRHLPFKSGAVWLILDYLAAKGPPLQVIPVGIHYECPCGFRAKVEVVIGEPISTRFSPEANRLEQIRILKARMRSALEKVGINLPSDEAQELVQRLGYGATLGSRRSYFQALKALEAAIPHDVPETYQELERESRRRRLLLHQGVPLFPTGSPVLYAVFFLVTAPLVLVAILINLPAYGAAWLAGRALPDDRNVVSLWKILVGLPAFAVWAVLVLTLLIVAGHPQAACAYVLVSWIGLRLYYRVGKLAVALHNFLRAADLSARASAFHRLLIEELPYQNV